MWLLILLILAGDGTATSQYVLETFPFQRQCQVEGERIAAAMAAAYPGETDYQIVCAFQARRVT
jgi:hypothetical protein